jgi:hypothetical protein
MCQQIGMRKRTEARDKSRFRETSLKRSETFRNPIVTDPKKPRAAYPLSGSGVGLLRTRLGGCVKEQAGPGPG